jgi:hypothetical protein
MYAKSYLVLRVFQPSKVNGCWVVRINLSSLIVLDSDPDNLKITLLFDGSYQDRDPHWFLHPGLL